MFSFHVGAHDGLQRLLGFHVLQISDPSHSRRTAITEDDLLLAITQLELVHFDETPKALPAQAQKSIFWSLNTLT